LSVNINNYSVVILGVSGDIGMELAKRLTLSGAKVIGFDKLHVHSDYLCEFFQGDASNYEQVNQFAILAIDKYKIDAVVCCAGTIGEIKDAESLNPDLFLQCLQSSVMSTVNFVKAFTKYFKSKNSGNFIFLSSYAGLRGNALMPAYTAAKHAINGLMKSYARELGPFGIRVNSVLPGLINSEMAKHINHYLDSRGNPSLNSKNPSLYNFPDSASDGIPLRRLGTPNDVAKCIIFLLSKDSSYVHGCMLNVDGGLLVK